MDLKQRKLNKSEWESIEKTVSDEELVVLKMIMAGVDDVNIRINNNVSLITFLKIDYSEKMEDFIFDKYLRIRCEKIEKEIKILDPNYKESKKISNVKLNSADKIRTERFDDTDLEKKNIYEHILLEHIEKIVYSKQNKNNKAFHFHYYTLFNLIRNSVAKINRHIVDVTNKILAVYENEINKFTIIENADEFIEKNKTLLKYRDLVLYEHQKEIFTVFRNGGPKLVLYMAPTGTGKTLTPIALSQHKRVIFVCAARHVGLQLARAAISVNKKIAFAFGCNSAGDIRLHYYAAKEYTINKRSGGIGKVDNSIGDNVEIMICDIKSYIPAMYYMLAFNSWPLDIITYWDEPTITMDYNDHEFHETIRNNWRENVIPNIVLSSATLPKMTELTETIPDFLNKFNTVDERGIRKYTEAKIHNIVSHDCKKSIPIINKDGYVVLPHYLHNDYDKILEIATHCSDYLTLTRYFDLKEVVEFISYIIVNNFGKSRTNLERHFETLNDINMNNIKKYYVFLLQNILNDKWEQIHTHFIYNRKPKITENNRIDPKGNRIIKSKSLETPSVRGMPLAGSSITRVASEQISSSPAIKSGTSGVYITTKDSYTLTDGPTIFISNDIEKIAKFCIQQANIPPLVMDDIMKKIEYNNYINEKIAEFESNIDIIKEENDKMVKNELSGRNKSNKESKKYNKELPEEFENKGKVSKLVDEINNLRSMIKSSTLNDTFIPNRKLHLDKWAAGMEITDVFTSNIDEGVVSDIMALNGVDNLWKVLLMMGIGVFINHENIAYTEIMKKLADDQKLYMIIASSDYIYGTNYQFCHGFISKDLDLTQEKIIQAMGRIGRNNVQKNYTIRFRDDEQILKLFTSETEKPEIINMNRLFNERNVVWKDNLYVEVSEEDENA